VSRYEASCLAVVNLSDGIGQSGVIRMNDERRRTSPRRFPDGDRRIPLEGGFLKLACSFRPNV
jgi:hypothetical protein